MIHWFKRHPQHLIAESMALSRDINYKELYQVRDNLFISHGYILVRLEKTHRFPVLIVYPEATPYVLPAIYPLTQALIKDHVDLLAAGKFEEVFCSVSEYIRFYYHLRHQNQTGVLCILEWDSLDDGSKFYGITSILRRVGEWFKGTLTGVFPPDSQEVEFYAHFANVPDNLKLLYPEKFLNERWVEGEAYCLLFSHIRKGNYRNEDSKVFFGCVLTGISRAGIIEQVEYDLPNFFYDEGIRTAIELMEKVDVLKRLVNTGRLLRSPWFQLQSEPPPFKSFTNLIELIGEGDHNAGMKRMLPHFAEEQKEKPDHFFVALRFPNRKGIQEFQLFKVFKNGDLTGYLFSVIPEETFRHFLASYSDVQAIRCEKFTDETYHLRNTGRAERSLLRQRSVNIIGVGALGSEIADSLSKAGVGTISLYDNQLMRGPNPVRHLAGLDVMDLPKVIAVSQIISNHNPFIQVRINVDDMNSIDLNERFDDDSISVSSMAEDNTEGYLNERAVISRKIVYYARALRGGKVARIFRVIPGRDACFHCLQLYRSEGREIVNVPEDKELPTLKNECNNPVRPASAADLKLIAALTSRVLLDELQRGYGKPNHWIWSSEAVAGIQPFQLQTQTIFPHPTCYYCHHERKAKVLLNASTLKQMQDLVSENPRVETGGVLAGLITENGDIAVTHASGPGPLAVMASTRFEKDVEYCQSFLDDLFLSSGKKFSYIGEWHSHPMRDNQPSGTDIKSLSAIASQKEYLTDMPLMIIFSNDGVPSCTIHPAGKTYYFADFIHIP